MFDVIVDRHPNTTPRDFTPLVISWALHTLLVAAVVVLPLIFATDRLPDLPKEVLTYVPAIAPPAPPPPPPAPATAATPAARPSPRPVPRPLPVLEAPVVVPRSLPSPIEFGTDDEDVTAFGNVDGVSGGVIGGVPSGVIGGIVGGVAEIPAPPPPAPPAPVARPPVRAGGQIQAPALVKRVSPVYPPLALTAQVRGVVILEAIVDRDGRVEDVTVLRSVPLLDRAAVDAVRQWVYAPLLLNGKAERFVLTVTVSFDLS